MTFEHIIDRVIAAEQGYVDHPDDNGGPTNWGITEAVARANGWLGPMQDMPVTVARSIYRKRYIAEPQFDKVALLDEAVGLELVDTGVNMGPARAALFLQRCLNVFNMRGSRYADVFVDGRIGPVTLDALKAFLRWRGHQGSKVLCKALNCVQGERYIEIAERDERQESFTYGWFASRIEL